MSIVPEGLMTHEYFQGSGTFAKNRTQAHFTNIILCAANGYTLLTDPEVDYTTIRIITAVV
jgi:hypothetical protein